MVEIAKDLGQDDLFSSFEESKDKAEIVQVLKELFDKEKIPLITDLSDDEIRVITTMQILAGMKGLDSWNVGIGYFTTLLLSRNRKSRTEIIDAIKGYGEKYRNRFQAMMGSPGNNNMR